MHVKPALASLLSSNFISAMSMLFHSRRTVCIVGEGKTGEPLGVPEFNGDDVLEDLIAWLEKTSAGWRQLLTRLPELLLQACDVTGTKTVGELRWLRSNRCGTTRVVAEERWHGRAWRR
jgi:hypothetical protein